VAVGVSEPGSGSASCSATGSAAVGVGTGVGVSMGSAVAISVGATVDAVDGGAESGTVVGLGSGATVEVGKTVGASVGLGSGVAVACGTACNVGVGTSVGGGADSGAVVGIEVGVTETTWAWSLPAEPQPANNRRAIDAPRARINRRRFIFNTANTSNTASTIVNHGLSRAATQERGANVAAPGVSETMIRIDAMPQVFACPVTLGLGLSYPSGIVEGMPVLFDTDATSGAVPGGVEADPVDQAFELIRDHIGGLQPRSALRRIRRYQARLAALETSVIAAVTAESGDDRVAKRMLNDGKTSRGTIAKAAKRAAAAAKNKSLVDKMDSGDLSSEQVDVVADAASKTDGAAAVDESFINKIADTDPDQARSIADDFVAKHQTKDGVRTEHERQRKLRRTARYRSKKSGLDVLALEGDGVAVENMLAQIRTRANQLYVADGGRDTETGNHPRTNAQRMFDAAHELLCGVTTTATNVTPQPRFNTDSSRRSKPTIFVGLTLDHYLGLDPTAMAEQIGLGLIADTVVADYLEHADIIGALYDQSGSPLWIGRAKRHATLMQRYALIIRDKGCVQCHAPHTSCEVHHLTPWNAPAKGQTNLNQLALLCSQCHHTLHTNNHTLYQTPTNTWKTRPATPNETPPTPTNTTRNHPKRE